MATKAATIAPPGETTLLRRVAWRLVPLLTVAYLIAYIDRANVGYAKLTMLSSLHMSEAAFGFASSLFFIGYLCFEVPSNLAMHRFGARAWISRIMFTWGLATVFLAFTPSATIFQLLRFVLGASEAGLYPGIIFYLTLWFPQKQRTGIVGLLTLGSSLGNMFGSAVGGASLDLNGLLGLQGWQWVFLTTGVPAVLMTFVTLAFLPSTPKTARFLSNVERDTIVAALQRDPPARKVEGGAPWSAASIITVGLLSLGYGTISVAIYGIAYWLPTLVRGFGVTNSVNGLLNMVPWGLTSLVLLWVPRRLTDARRVLRAAIAAALIGIVLFVISVSPVPNAVRFAALSLGAPALYLMIPCFWAMPPRLLPAAFLKGAAGAAALAAIATGSSLGGFVAQNIMPWIGQATGSNSLPMIVPAVCLAVLGSGAVAIWQTLGVSRSAVDGAG
jgi:MFS family permease